MSRPAIRYPVNHHLSQILERAAVIGAVAVGDLVVEGGFFNGDEPEKPDQLPSWSRFGDSWSVRATAMLGGVELQLSRARVESPEHRQGSGLDHAMWNGSARFERETSLGDLYTMAEVSHTDEEGAYEFIGVLAEAALGGAAHRSWIRFERTERPEEIRSLDNDFRGVRPHNENANLGTTRWTTLTAGYGYRFSRNIETVAEASRSHVTLVGSAVFDPESFYGRNDFWAISVGLRISAGAPMHRMGRYGVSAPQTNGQHRDH